MQPATTDVKPKDELEHFEGVHTHEMTDNLKVDLEASEPDPAWLAAEKKVVRKLDMTLMPLVWILYMFNYLDRTNIAQARLNGFEDDLGLKGKQFNTAISILTVGYMLCQLPSNMLLTRVRPSLYIPLWVAIWSIISACTAAARNYTDLIVLRFFLGVVEAPFFPGVTYLLSCWYPRRELAFRIAILYSGLVVAVAFSGLVAAGVFAGLDGVRGLKGWQWLFIIEGAGSFFAALVGFFICPDFPGQRTGVSKWLFTDEELKVAVERMERDRVSVPEEKHTILTGVKLAAIDIRTWVFCVMLLANHSAYGFSNFFPTIVKGFHLGDRTTTLLLTAPPYLFGTFTALLNAWHSDRSRERGFHISVPQAIACVGFIVSAATLNSKARYFSAFLYTGGCYASNAVVFTWAAGTLSQTPEKRAAATAIINLMSQFGNIYSPYFFPKEDGPRYIMANMLMMSFSALSVVTCIVMKWLLTRANRKIEQGGGNVVLYTL